MECDPERIMVLNDIGQVLTDITQDYRMVYNNYA